MTDHAPTPDASTPDRASIGHEFEFELDRAIAVRATDDPGRWDVELDAGFTVGPKPNGGYLLALLANAAVTGLGPAAAHPHPLAASATYLRAPDPGPAQVRVDVLRAGRSASQVRTVLEQDGRPSVEATFTLGTLTSTAPVWTVAHPVDVAPLADCIRLPSAREGSAFVVSTMDRVDLRLDPASMGFAFGTPTGRGSLAGWIDLPDGRPVDPISMLFLLDTLPPATPDVGASGWVPTLTLTTYVRALPAPGPLRVRQRIGSIADGRIDEVCELWDATGALVAQATQLAAVRFEDEASIVAPPA